MTSSLCVRARPLSTIDADDPPTAMISAVCVRASQTDRLCNVTASPPCGTLAASERAPTGHRQRLHVPQTHTCICTSRCDRSSSSNGRQPSASSLSPYHSHLAICVCKVSPVSRRRLVYFTSLMQLVDMPAERATWTTLLSTASISTWFCFATVR